MTSDDDDDKRDPELMTPEEREAYAMRIAERIDKQLQLFVKLMMPPGLQYVFIFGTRDKVGGVLSNIDDRYAVKEFLDYTQHRLNLH